MPSYTWWYFSFLPLFCHHIHDVFFDNWMSNTTTYLEYQLYNVTRYMMVFLHDARRLLRLSFLFPLFFHHICDGNTMRQQVMFHHVCGGIHVSFSSFPFLLKKWRKKNWIGAGINIWTIDVRSIQYASWKMKIKKKTVFLLIFFFYLSFFFWGCCILFWKM